MSKSPMMMPPPSGNAGSRPAAGPEAGPAAIEGFPLPTAGQEFDKYTLLAKLATGGMAELFVAELSGAAGFSKKVVIKRILPHVAHDEQFIRMFLDEAITCAQINHPNVCQVFELCESQDTHFLVLEHLEGATVGELIRRCLVSEQQLNMHLAAGIIVQSCDGLHAAHEQVDDSGRNSNLVHRDVSPGNLFVTVDGIVKVLDFGIAKARWMSRKTKTGTLLGKCEYMSPEQARGGTPLDRRSDIFSLGIIAWELVVGRRLFRRESEYETLRAVLRAPIERPIDLRPSIPPALDEAIMRALERDPDDRHRSAYEFRQAVADALRDSGGPTPMCDIAPLIRSSFSDELRLQRAVIRQASKSLEARAKGLADFSSVPRSGDNDENFANSDVLTSEHPRLLPREPVMEADDEEEGDSVELTFQTVPGEEQIPDEAIPGKLGDLAIPSPSKVGPPQASRRRSSGDNVAAEPRARRESTAGASDSSRMPATPVRTTELVAVPAVPGVTSAVPNARIGSLLALTALVGVLIAVASMLFFRGEDSQSHEQSQAKAVAETSRSGVAALAADTAAAGSSSNSAVANAKARAQLLEANRQAKAVVTALPSPEDKTLGTIEIRSSQEGLVYLYPAKTLLGKTPLVHKLKPGNYKLKLELGPQRGQRKYFNLKIHAGETTARTFTNWPSAASAKAAPVSTARVPKNTP